MRRLLGILAISVTCITSACFATRVADDSAWQPLPAGNLKPQDSTCTQVLSNVRTSVEKFYLYLRLGAQSPNADLRIFQLTALQEILSNLSIPDTVDATFAWGMDTTAFRRTGKPERPSSLGERSKTRSIGGEFDAWVSFDVSRAGRIDSINVRFPSQLPALHEMIVRAVRRADSVGAVLPVPDNLNAPQRFDLRLVVRAIPESGREPLGTTLVRFPTFTKFARHKYGEPPQYPATALLQRREGTVLVSFVIDTVGHVVPGSERVLSASDMDFAREVGANLRKFHFQPAEFRGCKLPIRVSLPFEFSIGG